MLRSAAVLLAFAALLPVAAAADPWDEPTIRDDGPTTLSELAHGSNEVHDLKAKSGQGDQDWFRIRQEPYASYEVVVDGAVGDVTPISLQLIAADGTTVVEESAPVGLGAVQSLRFENATGTPVDDQFVVVRSGGCAKCKARDVYRLRAYETTYAVPRFNNSGSQVTVLLLQNPTGHAIDGTVRFWSAVGALLHAEDFSVDAKQLFVLQTQVLVPLQGQTGSVTISHDGRYGDLDGKALALEPATGFSFDTPIRARAH